MVVNRNRSVNGILLLDKPSGLSSNAALQVVKRLYCARKAGHTGSLDPLASGMLPICLGEATKFAGFLLDANKRYRFACQLGVVTDTGDAEGEVVSTRAVPSLTQATVADALAQLTGDIQQLPPMYSALKHQGQRLYKLARQGQVVERQPRPVTIHSLNLLSLEGDRIECEVHCSKGTYVRTLAADLGELLSCGAHVVALRRVGVEPYDGNAMMSLDELEKPAEQGYAALDALLLPLDSALAGWPVVHVSEDMATGLSHGQSVRLECAAQQGPVRLYHAERFLGVGEISADERVKPRRLISGVRS
ncbi:MAG: tRNA pseudouridine(55) synthase TruB [Candidatus Competibacteraceae bacterium]|nr:tRNA pseudouridine(55) synthase TruB [Candidatus Competibacteraceae bacterium]